MLKGAVNPTCTSAWSGPNGAGASAEKAGIGATGVSRKSRSPNARATDIAIPSIALNPVKTCSAVNCAAGVVQSRMWGSARAAASTPSACRSR